ncbi:MAG: tetratricopeptide repeat protein [Planctomycetota bacterium]|nr:MAG: tetratricopeptide repeat protein [Planctomycetota bacterium]
MPDETEPAEQTVGDETPEPVVIGDPVGLVRTRWREFWQVPVLLAAAAVLLLGVAIAVGQAPEPEFGGHLTRAENLIERERYAEAIELLNNRVYPWINDEGALSQADRQRYYLAKARAIYYGQKKLGIDDDRNHVSVIREYQAAEREGLVLGPRDIAALADTYLSRSDIDSALRRLATLPPGSGAVRDPVIRRAVSVLMRPPAPDRERALALLAEVLADADTTIEQRVWALERQSNIWLDQQRLDETITRLLREMPRLTEAGPHALARLHLVLARAYRMAGADAEASRQIGFAEQMSVPGDPHYPSVVLERGRLFQRAGMPEEARERFALVAERFADSDAYAWAMLGLAETEAWLGEATLSLDAYRKLIDEYDALEIHEEPTRRQIMESLVARAGESLSQGDPALAIRFGTLAERAAGGEEIPSAVLGMMASAHEQAAEELAEGATTRTDPLVGLDPATRAEVQRHLLAAATYRRMFADRFLLTDLAQYADSLWRAGDLFDRAGDQREAIQAFRTFTESMPSDPKYAEAKFRVAEALRAMGDFAAAAENYKDLIAEREGSSGSDIGAWADAAYVPLAQAYLYDEDPGNDAEAERLLLRAVDGTMAGTNTDMFREALGELATLYDRTGRHARAIERLEELIERYPEQRDTGLMTYRLGEANRRLADEIEASIDDALPPATRAERQQQVLRHREEAITRYRAAIDLLSAKREVDRSRFEDLALRNAHFYLGDCLSDLGRYDEAVRAYDLARDRYPNDAATLVALIQIVNAHLAQGDLRRARTANERARRFYLSLPDTAWDDPALPMDRKDWEAWLDASAQLLAAAGEPGS